MNPTTMMYGEYSLVPVPIISLEKNFQKSDSGEVIGTIFNLTLSGTLVASPTGGIKHIDDMQDELRESFDEDGKLFEIKCGEDVLLRTYPRINNIVFSETTNNWVFTANYTIELEFDDEPVGSGENSDLMPPYISSFNEQWTVEFADDSSHYNWGLDSGADANPYQLRVTHTVTAVGKSHYSSGGLDKEAWQQARDFVVPRLGFDSDYVENSGVLNLNSALFAPFNHLRTNEIDIAGGGFNVTETWLVINPSGSGIAGKAIENFSATLRKEISGDISTVSIEGTIRGLEEVDFDNYEINTTKWENANSYWNNVESKLVERAKFVSDGIISRSINITPILQSVGHNPSEGVITYTYEFNDRPVNCVSGALTEDIIINDSNAVDIFASLPILGRASGPILQDMGTVSEAVREISIDVTMPLPTGCPSSAGNVLSIMNQSPSSQVAQLLCAFQTQLQNSYGSVFKSADQESWSPKTGRYTRNVAFTYTSCSGVPTGIC